MKEINKKQFTTEVGGKKLTLEFSVLAEQANAAVLAKYGETVVLATAVMAPFEATTNYLPLKVDYEERFYAAGKIIGSRYVRREGRPSEDAMLAGRLVDRTIRPLFDQRIRRDMQVVVTVLAIDEENEPDFTGLIAASAALGISDIPWAGPVGGIRVAKIGNDFVVNPNNSRLAEKDFVFETFAAGPKDRINMIELSGMEAQESDVMHAFELAQAEINKLIDFQAKIIAEIGKPKFIVKLYEPAPELRVVAEEFLASRLEEAVFQPNKMEHSRRLEELKQQLLAHLVEKFEKPDLFGGEHIMEEMISALAHKEALTKDRRVDGRKITEIRPLYGEVGLFSRTHGSALFIRGNTQALAVTTLAAPGAEQLIETMETTGKRRFMLHYNFPSYSVGEVGNFRGPGRREIGHGALAEKALKTLIPPVEQFQYTIRVVTEILSSNGSSSMATVCATTMSLLDAGVPLKKPVAGIAMGLMMDKSGENFRVLTDLQGPEDHYGDMDFKVAGTKEGITAIQMDVKVFGLTKQILEQALKQAKDARLEILGVIDSVIPEPRKQLSIYAPTIIQLKINPEKIGMVIGPGGKMINGMIRDLGLTTIDIEEDGSIFIAAIDKSKAEEAASQIRSMTREFTVGEVITGKVVRILDFGAIVDLGGGQDGMIHVSELKNGFVKTVTEVIHLGDIVTAKIIKAEEGKIGLSLKQMEENNK
ncbi:MAG TPA: polyribonucleotide nucleotidyltransferase [Candidatus Paceibacterota bacterium]